MLQACLNGGRGRDFHPALPSTPAELARDAKAAVAAGAEELHVHPRGLDGAQSLEVADIAASLAAIRAVVPGVPVGISTLWTIPPGGRARQPPIRHWQVLPDYVSVNLSEEDAPEIMALMIRRGIGIEVGLATVTDARRLVALPACERCQRVLIEIAEQDRAEGLRVAHEILAVLNRAGFSLPIQLHGANRMQWPMFDEAVRLGLSRRVGLEDGAELPDGTWAADNADLLRAAVARASA